jgi:DNA-binding NtrC family response regulator
MIERWGFLPEAASDGAEALARIQESAFDIIVTDLMMPGMGGIELLKRLKDTDSSSPSVIVLTAYGNVDTAITTVHDYGAFWYIEKPLRPRAFRMLLERAVTERRLLERSARLERQISSYGRLGELTGSSASMQELFLLIPA